MRLNLRQARNILGNKSLSTQKNVLECNCCAFNALEAPTPRVRVLPPAGHQTVQRNGHKMLPVEWDAAAALQSMLATLAEALQW